MSEPRDRLPEMTADQYYALRQTISAWLRVKERHESRWSADERRMLTQLAADVDHSSLLMRMVYERKPPLDEPPPLDHAYPVYPKDSDE